MLAAASQRLFEQMKSFGDARSHPRQFAAITARRTALSSGFFALVSVSVIMRSSEMPSGESRG
jgi:hypothetical protein